MGARVVGNDQTLQWVGNSASVAAILGTIFGWLPPLAAFIAIVWYAIQIYESKTCRQWIASRRRQRMAKLKARIAVLEAKAIEHDKSGPSR